ncbi:hypothetical protein ACLB2K_038395 [Fragaria x ananassa]
MVALLSSTSNQASMWSISLLLDSWLKSLKSALMVLEVSNELSLETSLKCGRLSILQRPTHQRRRSSILVDTRGIPDDFTMKMKVMEIKFEGLGNNLHPKLQTRSISAANWYSASPLARDVIGDAFGVRSDGGAPSSMRTVENGETPAL